MPLQCKCTHVELSEKEVLLLKIKLNEHRGPCGVCSSSEVAHLVDFTGTRESFCVRIAKWLFEPSLLTLFVTCLLVLWLLLSCSSFGWWPGRLRVLWERSDSKSHKPRLWVADARDNHQIHRERWEQASWVVKRAMGCGKGPEWRASLMAWGPVGSCSKVCLVSPWIVSMRSDCFTCASISASSKLQRYPSPLQSVWSRVSHSPETCRRSCDFPVCICTFAGAPWIDGFRPLKRNNNVSFTLVLWWEIFAIIVFTWKIYLPLSKCQV